MNKVKTLALGLLLAGVSVVYGSEEALNKLRLIKGGGTSTTQAAKDMTAEVASAIDKVEARRVAIAKRRAEAEADKRKSAGAELYKSRFAEMLAVYSAGDNFNVLDLFADKDEQKKAVKCFPAFTESFDTIDRDSDGDSIAQAIVDKVGDGSIKKPDAMKFLEALFENEANITAMIKAAPPPPPPLNGEALYKKNYLAMEKVFSDGNDFKVVVLFADAGKQAVAVKCFAALTQSLADIDDKSGRADVVADIIKKDASISQAEAEEFYDALFAKEANVIAMIS